MSMFQHPFWNFIKKKRSQTLTLGRLVVLWPMVLSLLMNTTNIIMVTFSLILSLWYQGISEASPELARLLGVCLDLHWYTSEQSLAAEIEKWKNHHLAKDRFSRYCPKSCKAFCSVQPLIWPEIGNDLQYTLFSKRNATFLKLPFFCSVHQWIWGCQGHWPRGTRENRQIMLRFFWKRVYRWWSSWIPVSSRHDND